MKVKIKTTHFLFHILHLKKIKLKISKNASTVDSLFCNWDAERQLI